MSADEETRPLHELRHREPAQDTRTAPDTEEPPMTEAHPTPAPAGTERPERPEGATRDVRPVSLVLGVLYLGVVAVWALAQSAVLGVDDLGLVLPVMLLVAGLAGLAGLSGAGRRRGGTLEG